MQALLTSSPASPLEETLGVYVHFPWCLSKCPYCDFVAFGAPRTSIDGPGYTDAVLGELSARAPALGGRRVASIFFGGGTPSLWGATEVGRVIEAVGRAFSSEDELEVSLECDPSSLDEDLVRALVDAGVNRLSIGVQALDDDRLRFLGRIHTRHEAIDAVRAALRAGMPRVSTDLMYAVAGQKPEAAALEAKALADLGVTHVSAYSLTIENDTPFGKLARRGRLPLCEDAIMAESFFAIDETLSHEGFRHYEVSNYATPGHEARHNLGYWRGRDYLGLGCGAYGTLRARVVSPGPAPAAAPAPPPVASPGPAPVAAPAPLPVALGARRYRNHATPRAYLDAARGARADSHFTASEEQLDGAALLRERIMLGLRIQDGFDLESAAKELGTDPYPGERRAAIAALEARGRITRRETHIAVPREAWIWVDDTAATLF